MKRKISPSCLQGKGWVTNSEYFIGGSILLSKGGSIHFSAKEHETVWLTQKLMAELFQTSVPNINMRIKNIFDEGELAPDSVIQEFLATASDGKK